MITRTRLLAVGGLCVCLIAPNTVIAQGVDEELLPPMRWRDIGPDRGGRSIAVAGHKDRPFEYYFGATGGGLWKTTDGGASWAPVTDGKITSASVGAVAVAESDPDIVYLGMGETQFRGNVLQGDGVYRSNDGGRTWTHLGLAETQAIGRVRIHPTNPDRVFVAALGHSFGSHQDRGVYRTVDGGHTWERVLFVDERTGALDLIIDPSDPNVLYATTWEVYRKPWKLWSGGPGSGLFKSTDGGDTWALLSRNPGFPEGVLGKVTVTVSGADSRRVYANVEAEDGGLYRSDDGGSTWTLINNNRDLWQRAFYFLRVVADAVDRNTVYVLSFTLLKSTDGGATFQELRATHADHHDLWSDPTNPMRMIEGNDGGGVVSVNGGRSWTQMRYPTAQIYRLATTNEFPYHVCGAQQDNTTVCVSSERGHLRNPSSPSGEWMYSVGGGESGYIAPHPTDPDIFYAGATNALTRYDRTTGLGRDIQPWPRIVMGEPARDMPERWNWTYPIAVSLIDPDVLYVGSQHLWRSGDEGATWERISPDLTRAEPETLEDTGGPIVFDQDGPEVYGTLYYIAPSPHDRAVVWAGSDDGLVHVTRDGGAHWDVVTPPTLPAHSRIMTIELSPHAAGVAYVAAMRYEMDDRAPYLFKTDDFGDTWKRITFGIPPDEFVRVVREDVARRGLLFAGTERGVYMSLDDGANWQSLSLNLPVTPVTGLSVEDRDLVISTHGRSFWVLDDIQTLRQIDAEAVNAEVHLYRPADGIRRPVPTVIDFYLRNDARAVTVEILDAQGNHVRTLADGARMRAGTHRISWDLRYDGAISFSGIVLEGGDPTRGPWAPPGAYQVRLGVDDAEYREYFAVHRDPRLSDVTDADLRAQFELAWQIKEQEHAANSSVLLVRDLRGQAVERLLRSDDSALQEIASAFVDSIDVIERALYQVRNQSPKDKIAFPIKLNDRLTGLRTHLELGDAAPTDAFQNVYEELSAELYEHLRALERALSEDLPKLNSELERVGLEPIELPTVTSNY